MSVLQKILAGEKKYEPNEKLPEKARQPADLDQKEKSYDTHEKNIPGPAEPPCPCLECWSPTFWRSRYGGPLRCAVCDPWPTLVVVGSRWTIVARPEGALEWMACPRWGERAGDRDPPSWTTVTGLGIVGSFSSDEDGDWLRLERLGAGDV